MRTKIISLVLLLVAIGMFVQCKGNDDGNQKENDATKTEITKTEITKAEVTENDEAVKTDSTSKKEKLTKVLTKRKKGQHADDIVILTPAFIKAVQKYRELGSFSDGLAAVLSEHGWGYINTKGELVIPDTIQAKWVGPFSEGIAFAIDYENYSFIDTKGRTVLTCEKDGASAYEDCDGWGTFSDNMPCYINGKLEVMKMDGAIEDTIHGVTKYKFDVFDNCGNKTTVYQTLDCEEIPDENDTPSLYTIFEEEGKSEYQQWYGIKDSKGRIVIPAKYNDIGCYSNGVFLVGLCENDEPNPSHWGYVDLKGNDTFPKNVKKRCRRR